MHEVHYVVFINQLEKGPSGKIKLEVARQQMESQLSEHIDSGNETELLMFRVRHVAAEVFRMDEKDLLDSTSPTNTPSWDSLAHMNFILELENVFSISLSTRDIMHIDSIAKAINICQERVSR